eukprot:GHUV01018665.1.p1 GENE.GHUV01018665.1~~GHUV01018665.1.p1  ORF type:complete len:330 (+),score=73.91 GHUV01018665.1:241-1230(+)
MPSSAAAQETVSVQAAEALVNKCRATSNRVSVYAKKLVGEQDAFAVEIKSLQANLQSLRKAAASVKDRDEQDKIMQLLSEASATIAGVGPGGDLRRLCNPKMPRLLSYLLGNKVNLVTIRKDQAVGIREEYHAFRNKAVWVMGTMPMLLYLGMKRADHVTEGGKDKITLTPALLTGLQVYLAWLCYFYVAMALRECVLLVNGSHIRSWWISHHMWSALGSLLMLALPISSPSESNGWGGGKQGLQTKTACNQPSHQLRAFAASTLSSGVLPDAQMPAFWVRTLAVLLNTVHSMMLCACVALEFQHQTFGRMQAIPVSSRTSMYSAATAL